MCNSNLYIFLLNIKYWVLFQFLNLQCTFNWNFSDIFVICISFYLISRFEQVNKKIAATRGKVKYIIVIYTLSLLDIIFYYFRRLVAFETTRSSN